MILGAAIIIGIVLLIGALWDSDNHGDTEP
jgi:hypothetical protein